MSRLNNTKKKKHIQWSDSKGSEYNGICYNNKSSEIPKYQSMRQLQTNLKLKVALKNKFVSFLFRHKKNIIHNY